MSDGHPDMLSVVLVGAGVVARKHLKAIRYLKKRRLASLAAVVDTNEQAAKTLIGHDDVPLFTDLAVCLEALRPQVVAITTPSGTHAALAETAILAGCHVLIEKPMTLSIADADRLLALAETHGRKIAVGHIYRYVPLAESLKAMASDGRFGACLYGDVKVRWGHDQAYYDQAEWRGSYAADGGVLMNQSIHAIDLMQWLIGEKAIESVAMAARQTHVMEAEDLALGVVRFENNVYLQVEGSTSTDPTKKEAAFTLFFEKGEMRVSLFDGKLSVSVRDYARGNVLRRPLLRALHAAVRREGSGIVSHLGNPHTFLYLDFIRAILAGGDALADGHSGRNALATVLSLYRAAKERVVVSVASTAAFPIADMAGVPAVSAALQPLPFADEGAEKADMSASGQPARSTDAFETDDVPDVPAVTAAETADSESPA